MRANEPNIIIKVVPQRRLLWLIGRVALENSTTAYLVGGPLRDIILGKKIVDLDVAVEDKVRTIGRRLSRILRGNYVFHYGFKTCTITTRNGTNIDLAQTRTEIYEKPAMLPKVSNSDIVSDLHRRDFTINAMAMDLSSRRFGVLIDPYGGFRDLKKGLVRVLHRESFIDDPTRIFRALRFAARLGFRLEPETKRLMAEAIEKKVVTQLSGERILHEIELILKEKECLRIFKQLKGVLCQLGFRLPHNFFVNFKRLSRIEANRKFLLIYLFSFLDDLTKYPLKKETLNAIHDLRGFPKIEEDLLKAKKPSEIYRLLIGLSTDALIISKAIARVGVSRRIARYLNQYALVKIWTRGEDLKRLGIPPGRVYKKILDELLTARLNGKIRNRVEERRSLKKLVGVLC